MTDKRSLTLATVALTTLGAACSPLSDAETASVEQHRPVHVDSIVPVEEALRRFRATLEDHPAALGGGAPSRDELVGRFVEALEAGHEAGLAALLVSRAEFAYLYYPYTRYTSRPYELSPEIVWLQMQNRTSKGVGRALERYGGRPLGFLGYRCDDVPTIEADNRIWTGCVVQRRRDDGEIETVPVLGPILQRDGRFKFLSFANRL